MRTWLLIGLLVVGCRGRRAPEDIGDFDTNAAPTRLGCPAGTSEYGAPPPAGNELWCARRGRTGLLERHGPARTWWDDGVPKEVGFYADNLRTGHWWFWAADGRLEREGDYREGREHGWWIHYRPDGTVAEEGPMRDGARDGIWITYDPKTGVPLEGLWVAGEREGVWTEYDAEGRPVRERVYRHGRLISQREL